MCELSQRKLAAVLLDSEEPGMPKVRSFQLKILLTNRMTWDDFGYFGFRDCQGMPQTTVTTWQRAVPAAKAAGRIQGCKWFQRMQSFFSIENMAISLATKSYFNPFWARLQRVRKKTPSTAQVDFWFSWEQALWCLGLALESLVIMQVIRWSCHMPHWSTASSFLSPNLRNPVWMILPKKYCFWTAWTCSKRNLASEKRKNRLTSNFQKCAPDVLESREIDFLLPVAIRGLHNPRALSRWPLFCKTHWGEGLASLTTVRFSDGRRCHLASMDAFYIVLSRCFLSKKSIWRDIRCDVGPFILFFRYAGLLGFLRSAMKEHPELRLRLLCREAEAPVLLLGRTGVNL